MIEALANGKERMNTMGVQKIPFLFVIDFEMKNPLVIALDQLDPNQILYDIRGKSNYHDPKPNLPNSFTFKKKPVPLKIYRPAYERVVQELNYGNSFLLNLTFPTGITTNISLLQLYHLSKATYKLWIKDQCVVFSPEAFVRIKDGTISSYPMKGTIDASLPNAAERILNDPKEFSEHATIVDLIRNDLSCVATKVKVARFRYIDEIKTSQKTLLQVSSEITGQLPEDYQTRLGDIIYSLLPAGSICGAPKRKTIEIIKEVEHHPRRYFTGVFGYFDGQYLDSGVMIRFIEQQEDQLMFKSGGGITAQSELSLEYQEMIDKVYVPIN